MIFEYKVRARHRLGWKEFKLYADTDIEEFFNRNSIDYVRNLTDTVENNQKEEIERLNNIIDELENYLNEQVDYMTHHSIERMVAFGCCRYKLQELKGSDKK